MIQKLCDKLKCALDIALTKVLNVITINVTSTMLINWHIKKIRYKMDCYILQTVLLVIILLSIITIICYHYVKHRLK